MAAFGLALLVLIGLGLALTGLPAFLVVLAAAVLGAVIAVAGGADPAVFAALPLRIGSLLDNDLFQAIPLYVLMGALLNRLPVTDALFSAILAAAPRSRAAPVIAGLGLGALLGPMNGSAGASVFALSRTLAPSLAASGVPEAERHALVALAGTLGVVVPPSLVLILLGDAMLSAHTIAVNTAGRADRIINTQDVFRGALVPAALFLFLACCVALWTSRGAAPAAPETIRPAPTGGQFAIAVTALSMLIALLGGVAAGYLHVVEAAACGAVALFLAALVCGRLAGGGLQRLLSETMAGAGALFALLIAATTLTLALRVLGSDRLIAAWLAGLPGSPAQVTLVVLLVIGLAAIVLDAFEIIFVVIPIVAPPLLMRSPDAVWAAVLILFCLQTSFLLPPFGYALMAAQSALGGRVAARAVWRALAPYLLAQALVAGLVFAFPQIVHWRDAAPAAAPRPAETGAREPFERLAPAAEPAPLNFNK